MVFRDIIGSITVVGPTPTEAAPWCCHWALCIAAFYGASPLENMRAALWGTIRTTSMVMFVIVAGLFPETSHWEPRAFQTRIVGLSGRVPSWLWHAVSHRFDVHLWLAVFSSRRLALMIATIRSFVPIVIGLGFTRYGSGILLIVLDRDGLDHATCGPEPLMWCRARVREGALSM